MTDTPRRLDRLTAEPLAAGAEVPVELSRAGRRPDSTA